MGNPFKKKLNRLTGKSGRSAGWQRGQQLYGQAQGANAANQTELDAAMKEYENVPETIRKQYTDAAMRAGTYGNTSEFQSGLNSEVIAGSRGARVGIAGRINALKKALGHTDEFKPEGLGETQANVTQDALTQNPVTPADSQVSPEAAVAPALSDEGTQGPTSVGSLQDSARKKALVKRKGY